MKWSTTNYKESVNVYQTLAALVVTAGIYIVVNCHPGFRLYVAENANLRWMEWVTHGLFMWMIAALWVADRGSCWWPTPAARSRGPSRQWVGTGPSPQP